MNREEIKYFKNPDDSLVKVTEVFDTFIDIVEEKYTDERGKEVVKETEVEVERIVVAVSEGSKQEGALKVSKEYYEEAQYELSKGYKTALKLSTDEIQVKKDQMFEELTSLGVTQDTAKFLIYR